MPRDIPVGNGRMLVTFDQHYQIRDLYFPHVGQENHGGHGPCRFGVFTDTPEKSGKATATAGGGKLAWSSDGWTIRKRYLRDALTTSVSMEHPELKVALYCNDCVDFHRRVMIRRIKVRNLAPHARNVRLIHHQAWHMTGTNVGDTAYYDPDLESIVHYRGQRYILATFLNEDGTPGLKEYATGTSGFGGAEGTWRDAEDGHLQGNTIAQGAVDSCVAHHVDLGPAGSETAEKHCYLVLICAHSREELLELHGWLGKQTPQGVLDRTTAYWRLWVSGTEINFGDLPSRFVELFKRSLLTVRTQIDEGGAILAANDSDIMQFSRDTYSYVWPRDGALVADAMDAAGFPMLSRKFFEFCQRTITPTDATKLAGIEGGYLHHKYNPDGSVASSWHPWMTKEGKRRLPIQEDETALVVWALWRHFERHRDTEFIRPMWVDVVQPAADFMASFREPRTGLPLPSWDLWEERWGVHAFTVATVYAGLKAAKRFAVAFGDQARAEKYGKACDEIRAGAEKHLYVAPLGRFVRRLVPREDDLANASSTGPFYDADEILDASMWAIGHFGLFAHEDERFRKTMNALERRLWVKTTVGGMARYENDYYHRVSSDISAVAGNPWFICTLWLADDLIARAKTPAELRRAMPVLEWVTKHASESGVLAEQVHPETNAPLSVSPLTWSHAQVVSTAIAYLEKLEKLSNCNGCRQPLFHARGRTGMTADEEVEAIAPEPPAPVETLVAVASVPRAKGAAGRLGIVQADCIGCGACVTACAQSGNSQGGVLVSYRGKALIDARKLQSCDLDGACAAVCPTQCIKVVQEQSAVA
jgi:GH15 family glucan-1,4-alpha-glucosidase/ferredoxin